MTTKSFCFRFKLYNARDASIKERTAQKTQIGSNLGIYIKSKRITNQKPNQLGEEHKYHLVDYFDEAPMAITYCGCY